MTTLKKVLYRTGPGTIRNLTPRPDKDTTAPPGQAPGLSTFSVALPGRKAVEIDVDRLRLPLAAIPDDPAHGGTPNHVAIVPVDRDGAPDLAALQEWASFRERDEPHPFTQIVLDAIVR